MDNFGGKAVASNFRAMTNYLTISQLLLAPPQRIHVVVPQYLAQCIQIMYFLFIQGVGPPWQKRN